MDRKVRYTEGGTDTEENKRERERGKSSESKKERTTGKTEETRANVCV